MTTTTTLPAPPVLDELPRENQLPAVSVPSGGNPLPTPRAGSNSDSFFNSIRRLHLERTEDRWVGGVAAGIAHRLGWDPLIVRGLLVISFFLGGIGLIAYGVGWALLPEASDGRIHLQEAIHGRFDPALVAAGLVTFSGMISNGPFGVIDRLGAFGNFELLHWISGLFAGLFWTVAIVLFIRWIRDQRRYRKFLKGNPVAVPTTEFSAAGISPMRDDVAASTLESDSVTAIVPPMAEPAMATFVTDDPMAPAVLPEPVAAAVIPEAPAGVNPVAVAVVDTELPDASPVADVVVSPVAAAVVSPVAAAVVSPEDEKLAKRAAADAARANARIQADQHRAYQRQQREIYRYHRAVERSRKPITKGPGIVTLLLTIGSLFLVWTAAQAAMRGFWPGVAANSALANPLIWTGVALLVVGLGIFVSGIRGRRAGPLTGLAWLGLAALIPLSFLAAAVFGGNVNWSTGATPWARPAATAQAIGSGYVEPINLAAAELGFRGRFGSPLIDLSNLDLSHATPANPVVVPIEFSAGDVLVLLPPAARVEANVRLSAGSIYYQVTEPYPVESIASDTYGLDEEIIGTPETVDFPQGSLIVTTQNLGQAGPLRAPVFIASDAARVQGANLRLMISNGAGNVILREALPAPLPASPATAN